MVGSALRVCVAGTFVGTGGLYVWLPCWVTFKWITIKGFSVITLNDITEDISGKAVYTNSFILDIQ